MIRYCVVHTLATGHGPADLSPAKTRRTWSLLFSAWAMKRRMAARGLRMEIQHVPGGWALWRPGEEVRLVRVVQP
jgi:hypothetical protein